MMIISTCEASVLIGLYLFVNGRQTTEWSNSVKEARESSDTVPWFTILLCALVYISLSLGLTVFNKWIFIPDGANFPFPLTLCFLHLVTTCIVLEIVKYVHPAAMPTARDDGSPLKTRPLGVYLNASVPGSPTERQLAASS